jgi:hypothetical protein
MSNSQRQLLEEGLQAWREVFDTNRVSVNREQMRRLLNMEVMITQLVEGLKAVEGKSKDDLVRLMEEAHEVKDSLEHHSPDSLMEETPPLA